MIRALRVVYRHHKSLSSAWCAALARLCITHRARTWRKDGNKTKKIINLSNILWTASFFAMLAVAGAVDGERYITAIVLMAVFAVCAYLSMKEDGQIR